MTETITLETDLKKTGIHIIIDYFSASFPFICHVDDYELLIIEDIVNMIATFMNYSKEDVTKESYAQNRYKYQYTIGDAIILRLIGPELKSGYKSCMIELKGEGCRQWESHNLDKSWIEFLEFFLIRLNASPTRIDLTVDDYDGEFITFDWLKQNLDAQNYITSFKEKKYDLYGNNEDGWTIRMGGREGSQELVIYEKDKERLKKNKVCNQPYWLRIEMRFRQNKAYDIAMNIANLASTQEFKTFAMQRLYEILDIKDKNNNYNKRNFYKAPTDPEWLKFLDGVSKGKIKRYKIQKSTYETYLNFMNPKVASFIVNLLLQNDKSIYLTLTKLLEITLKDFDKMDERKLKRYNDYLKECGIKQIDVDELDELRFNIEQEIENRSGLPF